MKIQSINQEIKDVRSDGTVGPYVGSDLCRCCSGSEGNRPVDKIFFELHSFQPRGKLPAFCCLLGEEADGVLKQMGLSYDE